MSICETCKNSFSDRDEIHCKAMNGCRVDGLDFTHCKHYDEEQGPGFRFNFREEQSGIRT